MVKREVRINIEFPEVHDKVCDRVLNLYVDNIDHVGQLIYLRDDEDGLQSLSFSDFLTRFQFIGGRWMCN